MSINNLSLNCPAETEVCQLKNKYDEVYTKYKSVKYGDNYKKLGKSIEIKNLQQMNSKDRVDAIVEKESGTIMIYIENFYFYLKWLLLLIYAYILYKEYGRFQTYNMKGTAFYHITVLIFILICLV